MFCDKSEGGFIQEAKKQWLVLRSYAIELIEDGGIIDQYYEETKASAAMDAPINRSYEPEFDYKAAVEELKTWIRDRIEWIDNNIDTLDDMTHTVTFKVDNKDYMHAFIDTGLELEAAEAVPEKEGYVFLGWVDQNDNPVDRHTRIYEDTIVKANFVSLKKATKGKDIAFRTAGDITMISPHTSAYQIDYEVVPTDAQDKSVIWSSSDESLATVDNNGLIKYTGAGEVTITGKLSSGIEKSFILKITDGELTVPSSVTTDKPSVILDTGSQIPVIIVSDPFPARIHNIIYESEDEGIAKVDEYGVISAVSTGNTRIKIKTVTESDDQIVLETSVDVTVKEKASYKGIIIPLIFILVLAVISFRIITLRRSRS